jgi:hypothetical protein
MIFLDGVACRIPVFLRKGETYQNKHLNVRISRGKRYVGKQSCEDFVMAIVSWSIVIYMFVCKISIDEESYNSV